jgi:hypothetical protein
MREHIVTFDYEGITHPETGEELKGVEASMQFVREFEGDCTLPGSILAYRGFLLNIKQSITYYRFITTDEVDSMALSDLLQTHLYDEGGLHGDFYMGEYRRYEVSRVETVVRSFALMGMSEEEVIKSASIGGKVLSCKPVNVNV